MKRLPGYLVESHGKRTGHQKLMSSAALEHEGTSTSHGLQPLQNQAHRSPPIATPSYTPLELRQMMLFWPEASLTCVLRARTAAFASTLLQLPKSQHR